VRVVGVSEGLSGYQFKEPVGSHFKAGGKLDDGIKLDVRFGPLDATDVIPVYGTQLRKLLLREAPFNS
jgi:hypothetical protein